MFSSYLLDMHIMSDRAVNRKQASDALAGPERYFP